MRKSTVSRVPFTGDRSNGSESGKAADAAACNRALPPRKRRATTVTQLALVTLLVGAALALNIALTAGGGSDQAGATKSVRVTPSSGPLPPSPAERNQPPGLNGPGMRP